MANEVEKATPTTQSAVPSPNTLPGAGTTGRMAPSSRASTGDNQFAEIGVTGLKDSKGVIIEEFLPQLSGHRAIHVYRQMNDNDSVIGALMFAITNMLRPVKWTAEPADTTDAAKKEADFAESLFEDMEHTFEDFVSEALTMLTFGWSMHEVVLKGRVGPEEEKPEKRSKFDDGRIGIRKLAPRSQDTLWRWELAPDGTLLGMWQMPPLPVAGRSSMIFLPIERCMHLKTISRKGNPEGLSVLRNAYRSWWYATRIEELEAIGIERELAGAPVIRIPARYFRDNATDKEKMILADYKAIARDFKKNEQGGLVIPSDPWFDADGKPLPGQYQVDVSLIASGGTRQIDTNTVVARHQTNMARSVLADFIMMGNQNRGAYALSKNKTDLFLRACETFLNVISAGLNRMVLPQIWEANNLDHELMPKYRPGRIAPVDLVELGGFLRDMAGAGAELFPDVDLENYVRDMADLPEKTEEAIRAQNQAAQQLLAARMAPKQPGAPGAQPGAPGAAKPPAKPAAAPPKQAVPEPKATQGSQEAKKPNGGANGAATKAMPSEYYEAMLAKFNPNHEPAGTPEGGRFASSPGGEGGLGDEGSHPGHGYSKDATIKGGKIHTSNVNDAVRALWEGKKVELSQPRQVATLVDRLGEVAGRMIDMKGEAPNFNLCNASVAGTNLFCAESKGIPRVKMPQFEEDDLKKFRQRLEEKGYTVEKGKEVASRLKATQNELIASKVAKAAARLASGKEWDRRLFVSKDNYIVDGHHHWAATIAQDVRDNHLGDAEMKVARVDTDIITLLGEAKSFLRMRKFEAASLGEDITKYDAMLEELEKFNPHHDEHGRFSSNGGVAEADDDDEKPRKPHKSDEFTPQQIAAARRRARRIAEQVRGAYGDKQRGVNKVFAYRAISGIDLSKAIDSGDVLRSNRTAPVTFNIDEAVRALKVDAPYPYLIQIEMDEDADIQKNEDGVALLAGARLRLLGAEPWNDDVQIVSASLIG